uniref:Uncharacterized protein n=1 Tax=Spongospora subterranea TaxID=70186 RepID=A0A0H5QW83_9EUKA|eukprot:CRZ06248.1 hypothetical protein [Spongospora subterranea]
MVSGASQLALSVLLALVTISSAIEFTCEKSAFILVDADPRASQEFSLATPVAGGIILVQMNNETSTYHWDNTTWVKDDVPLLTCQVRVIADPAVPKCLNISGMPYCETPADIATQLARNATTNISTMAVWVNKVCQDPTSAFINVQFGGFGQHFLAAYQDTATMKAAPEFSPNITLTVNALLAKNTCGLGTGGGGAMNETMPTPGSSLPVTGVVGNETAGLPPI